VFVDEKRFDWHFFSMGYFARSLVFWILNSGQRLNSQISAMMWGIAKLEF